MTDRYISLVEVKDMLEKAEAARGELTYEQKLALEHARKFARFTMEGVQHLMKDLQQNAKIDAVMAIRIADLAPAHVEDLRALFAKTRVNLDEGELQKILESVSKYLTT